MNDRYLTKDIDIELSRCRKCGKVDWSFPESPALACKCGSTNIEYLKKTFEVHLTIDRMNGEIFLEEKRLPQEVSNG